MAAELRTESHLRSILKGISWRVIASTIIFVTVWQQTSDVWMALKVVAVEFPLKFGLYYLHERAWQQIPRGGIRRLRDRILGRK